LNPLVAGLLPRFELGKGWEAWRLGFQEDYFITEPTHKLKIAQRKVTKL
jgi:hypothetical protein